MIYPPIQKGQVVFEITTTGWLLMNNSNELFPTIPVSVSTGALFIVLGEREE
jgi:hypothetical protein